MIISATPAASINCFDYKFEKNFKLKTNKNNKNIVRLQIKTTESIYRLL